MMMISVEICICIYYFLGKYTGFTVRGYKCCFEMIFERLCFCPLTLLFCPLQVLGSVVGGIRGSSRDSDRPSPMYDPWDVFI